MIFINFCLLGQFFILPSFVKDRMLGKVFLLGTFSFSFLFYSVLSCKVSAKESIIVLCQFSLMKEILSLAAFKFIPLSLSFDSFII